MTATMARSLLAACACALLAFAPPHCHGRAQLQPVPMSVPLLAPPGEGNGTPSNAVVFKGVRVTALSATLVRIEPVRVQLCMVMGYHGVLGQA